MSSYIVNKVSVQSYSKARRLNAACSPDGDYLNKTPIMSHPYHIGHAPFFFCASSSPTITFNQPQNHSEHQYSDRSQTILSETAHSEPILSGPKIMTFPSISTPAAKVASHTTTSPPPQTIQSYSSTRNWYCCCCGCGNNSNPSDPCGTCGHQRCSDCST